MFTIDPMPEPVPAAKLQSLLRCETATVGHFLHSQFLDPAIRSVLPRERVVGTAVTVRAPGVDGSMIHWAVGHVRPGDFLIVDRAGDMRHACWGGVVTVAALEAGAAGAAIDGYGTDLEEIRGLEFPLWCRGPSPITTKMLAVEGGFNVPVSCGGVSVRPGDAILADESGILVLDPAQIDWVVAEAMIRQEREPERLRQLRAGGKLHELSGVADKIRAALAGTDLAPIVNTPPLVGGARGGVRHASISES